MHGTGTMLAQTVKRVLAFHQRPELLKVFINRQNAVSAFLSQQVLLIISYLESYSFILKIKLSLLTKPMKNAFPALFMEKKEQL